MLKKKPKVVVSMIVVIVVIVGIVLGVTVSGQEQETANEEGKKVESNVADAGKVQEEQQNAEAKIKYPANGNIGENISEFVVQSENIEIGTELSDAYLKSINYTVVEIDEEKMVAIIEMKVPDILTELESIVEDAVRENPTMGYEELLPIVKENLQKFMESEKNSTKTEQLEVAVEKVADTYKLVPSDELRDLLYKDLETAYLEILLNGWEK